MMEEGRGFLLRFTEIMSRFAEYFLRTGSFYLPLDQIIPDETQDPLCILQRSSQARLKLGLKPLEHTVHRIFQKMDLK